MKRELFTKIGVILAGLFLVPFFTLTVNATYTEIDPDISVDISGSVDKPVQNYNLYLPNEALTNLEEFKTLPLVSNKSIKEQLPLDYMTYLNEYDYDGIFNNSSFQETYRINDFNAMPSSDLWIGYTGYYVCGLKNIHTNNVQYDLANEAKIAKKANGIYESEFDIFQKSLIYYKRFYGCKNNINNFIKVGEYNELQTSSGRYHLTIELDQNANSYKHKLNRVLYFEPSSTWNNAGATFAITYCTLNDDSIKNNSVDKDHILPIWESVDKSIFKYLIEPFNYQFSIERLNPEKNTLRNYSGYLNLQETSNNTSYNNKNIKLTIKNDWWNTWTNNSKGVAFESYI